MEPTKNFGWVVLAEPLQRTLAPTHDRAVAARSPETYPTITLLQLLQPATTQRKASPMQLLLVVETIGSAFLDLFLRLSCNARLSLGRRRSDLLTLTTMSTCLPCDRIHQNVL